MWLTVPGAEPLRFDRVVVATHSDQALAMLSDATWREREILGAIPYQQNEAILHTDRTVLPTRRRAWASWNYHLLDQPHARTAVTYHLNRLQRLSSEQQFCLTLNLAERVAPESVIKRITYSHPVYTPEGVAAQRRLEEISGSGGATHFCGAYWGWGFHEDGVSSALRVAESFGSCDAARESAGRPISSCLYIGTVSHRRARPQREFHHRVAMVYVDLDELPGVAWWTAAAPLARAAALPAVRLPRRPPPGARRCRQRHG